MIRSHLYVPGDQPRVLERAEERGADAVIFDLEDAVAESNKDTALSAVLSVVARPRGIGQRWVRVNSMSRGIDDIAALAEADIDGIWLPKAEPGEWFDEALAATTGAGLRVGMLIESARGLVGMPSLSELPVDSLAQIGEIDLRSDLRIRDASEEAMAPYRARIVMEAALRGLVPTVGPVDPNYTDMAAFREGTMLLRNRGFGSRACIHPAQVLIVNEIFTPDQSKLDEARQVLAEFDASSAAGRGSYGSGGVMTDLATVRWARAMLDGAE
jgi:citrate lyase beta subunit